MAVERMCEEREWYAIMLPNGKYYSRGRFNPNWDGAFEVDRPELWSTWDEVYETLKELGEGEVQVFRQCFAFD